MGRILTGGSGSSGSSSNAMQVLEAAFTVNEAVLNGQVAVLAADNFAYYANDPANPAQNPYNTQMRPISLATTQMFPALQETPIVASGSLSNNSRVTSCMLVNGNYVLAYANSSNVMEFEILSPTGGLVATGSSGTTQVAYAFPSVTALTGGGFVIAFSETGGTGAQPPVFEIFNANGTVAVAQTTIDATAGYCYGLEVAALSNGNFAVCYHGGSTTSTSGKYAIYSATGAVVLAATLLATNAQAIPPNVGAVAICALSGGGFVCCYLVMSTSTVGGLSFQRFNAAGVLQGAATAINSGMTISGTSAAQEIVNIVPLTGGGFAIYSTISTSLYIYSATGVLQGASINIAATGSTTMLGTSDGGVAIMFVSSGGIQIAKFTATGGTVLAGMVLDASPATGPSLQVQNLADGTFLCSWTSNTSNGMGVAILSAAFGLVNSGFVPGVSSISGPSVFSRPNAWQVTNAVKSTAVTYVLFGIVSGSLSSIIVTTLIQKCTPLGVFAASGAQGNAVPVQYTGVATLATAFVLPYAINSQGASPPGQKMNVVGNSVILYGIQAPATQRHIN